MGIVLSEVSVGLVLTLQVKLCSFQTGSLAEFYKQKQIFFPEFSELWKEGYLIVLAKKKKKNK